MEARLHTRGPSPVPGRLQGSRGLLARAVLAAVVLVLAFWVVLPQLADYGQAWETLDDLSASDAGVLALIGAWNLFTYWPVLVLGLPGLTLREAAVVNQASTAVANTVPAGAAVSMGVTYRMLRAWGFTRQSITNQIVITGAWNNFVKLGLPVVAVGVLALTGELEGALVELAVVGLGGLATLLLVGMLLLRAEATTARFGAWIDRLWARRPFRAGPRSTDVAGALSDARRHVRALVRTAGGWLSLATVVSHLSLYAMFLVSLRAVGVGEGEVSWSKVFAAFAFVRLLSAVPVTPGGVGVVELGYVAYLSAGKSAEVAAAITAGVLLFRAITYALPIALGAIAGVVFRSREDWRRPADSRGDGALVEKAVG